MIDAHTHFNLEVDDPTNEYIKTLHEAGIDEAVLILNSPEEMEIFWENEDKLMAQLKSIHIVFLFDVKHRTFFDKSARMAEKKKLEYSIKLHPRLTNITKNDFDAIAKYIGEYSFRNIVIDSFLYGSNLESFCYIDLAIFMARKYPEHNVVMAHLGGIKVLETMLCTREVKNIFYDCAFSINYLKGTSIWMDLKHCIVHSGNRVMFGSDMPSFHPKEAEKILKYLLDEQKLDLFECLFEKNAREIYFN
ncbi:amidohydrolase family protein [Anaerovibrio sp. RM50]|uniref:amidohydrolase family protein n=1 Tax=Anaerovibrio sp. RM50 TaxID=1200557 RepID=UPI0018DD2127|nr:amidohydrolase family protein [Anaerovibrio sp. RM50]